MVVHILAVSGEPPTLAVNPSVAPLRASLDDMIMNDHSIIPSWLMLII